VSTMWLCTILYLLAIVGPLDQGPLGHRLGTPPLAVDLAGASDDKLFCGVFANTIRNFEHGISDPKVSTLHKWRRALESNGVEFIDPGARSDDGGPGVRLKSVKEGKRR
jgi:hypothetical protein